MSATDKPEMSFVDDGETDNMDAEKGPVVRTIDNMRVLGLTDDDAEFYANLTPEQRKRTTRKVSVDGFLYLISHLDRANIGNAKIEGLAEDVKLDGVQWNIALSLVPSNVLLKKFKRPSVYLGTLVTIWGVIMTLHGVVKNFAGLLVVRLVLGVFEAGFYPGAVFLCTFWYMPQQLAARIACFYCTSALSGAFSGLLAAAIAQMDGVGGYEGWRWIFILEGIFTVMLGVATFFLLIDSPASSSEWLTEDEIRFLELQRFIKQGGRFKDEEEEEKFKWADMKAVVTNWRLYLQAYALLATSACSYAIGVASNICVGNIGGIIGSYMYLDSEKPKYSTGFGLSLAFGGSGLIVALLLELSYQWGNAKREEISEAEVRAKYTEEELITMGDKSPLFRYTL
ncbi:putative transporter [Colletotrichum trifolii]|uniref:Putative transporter n=1 Tax=Colletotrichum trifolii TaxID=5466 RepID=A0A4R8R0Z1_COLTR|nr:putative transporter [Colletotrichum trifolii]